MIDTTLIGQVAADLMEKLPEEGDGEICGVGIVVVVDCGDEGTYARIKTSSERHFEQLGIFTQALDIVRDGVIPDDEDEDS